MSGLRAPLLLPLFPFQAIKLIASHAQLTPSKLPPLSPISMSAAAVTDFYAVLGLDKDCSDSELPLSPISMSAAAVTDFYAVLGLDKDCSDSELRNAYKKLALRWHPDRCSGKNEAKEKFQTIQEAYSVLSDPDKRLMYDIGVYNEEDDDENAGMEDFLGELAEMMSKNTPTESGPESFEELQRLFVEMFQSDIDAEFGGGTSGAGNGWNRGTSSSSHKHGSSAMNSGKAEFDEMDMGTGGFCYGTFVLNG